MKPMIYTALFVIVAFFSMSEYVIATERHAIDRAAVDLALENADELLYDDALAWIHARASLAADCRIHVEVYGAKGLDKEPCTRLLAMASGTPYIGIKVPAKYHELAQQMALDIAIIHKLTVSP